MATIRIHRPSQYANLLRRYRVLLDGTQAGTLKHYSELDLEVAAGSHTLQLRIDWCGSERLSFSIGENETAAFVCSSINPFFVIFYATLRPSRYLRLRRIS